jgi:hypothetical protein
MTEHGAMTDRLFVRLAGLALLLPALVAPGASQQAGAPPTGPPFDRLAQWAALVGAHAPGERDEAADRAATSATPALDVVLDELTAARDLVDRALAARHGADATHDWRGTRVSVGSVAALLGALATVEFHAVSPDLPRARRELNRATVRLLEAGALLHADAALVVPPVLRVTTGAEPDARGSLLVMDGRVTGIERTADSQLSTHVGFGSRLMDLAAALGGPAANRQAWYRATTAVQLRDEMFGDVLPYLEHALASLPDDPVLLFYSGALHEVFALPRSQAVIQSAELPPDMQHSVAGAAEELRTAERFYRRARDLDPAFTLAAVHHGRVLGLLGDHEASRATLEPARAAIADRPTQYYAELFLGDAWRGLGDAARARDHYARASALYPRARTPGLVASALLRAHGDRAQAVALIRQALGGRVGRSLTDDPWWTYHTAHAADAGDRLDAMRRALHAGGAR